MVIIGRTGIPIYNFRINAKTVVETMEVDVLLRERNAICGKINHFASVCYNRNRNMNNGNRDNNSGYNNSYSGNRGNYHNRGNNRNRGSYSNTNSNRNSNYGNNGNRNVRHIQNQGNSQGPEIGVYRESLERRQ